MTNSEFNLSPNTIAALDAVDRLAAEDHSSLPQGSMERYRAQFMLAKIRRDIMEFAALALNDESGPNYFDAIDRSERLGGADPLPRSDALDGPRAIRI